MANTDWCGFASGTVSQVGGSGFSTWSNSGNIKDLDDSYTYTNINTAYNQSKLLVVQGFTPPASGYPTGVSLTGIQARAKCYTGSPSRVIDSEVYLVVGGAVQAQNKALNQPLPGPVAGSADFRVWGGESDLWGQTGLTTDLFTSSSTASFGVAFSVEDVMGGTPYPAAYADALQLQFFWTGSATGGDSAQATMSATPTSGTSGVVVSFTVGASGAGSGSCYYSLDFGDTTPAATGTVEIGEDAIETHQYLNLGVFTAELSLTDPTSTVTTDSEYITVSGTSGGGYALTAAFSATSAVSGGVPLTVNFLGTGQSLLSPVATAFVAKFDYGDGASGGPYAITSGTGQPYKTASYAYPTPGQYEPRFLLWDSYGNAQNVAMGGGGVVTVAGSYSVSAETIPVSGYVPNPLPVAFYATPSGTYTGSLTYTWAFGDGAISSTQSATSYHTYTDPGVYDVSLTAEDESGVMAYATDSVTVLENEVGGAIVVSADPTYGQSPLLVTLSGTASFDEDPYTYEWDFGDGSAWGASANLTHTFSAGTFWATLYATGGTGATIYAPPVVISVSPAPGDDDFSVAATVDSPQKNVGQTFYFDVLVSGLGPTYAYAWTFGDGPGNSTAKAPEYSYGEEGTYFVTARVTDLTTGRTGQSSLSVRAGNFTSPTSATLEWSGSDLETSASDLQYAWYLSPRDQGFGGWRTNVLSAGYESLPNGNYTFFVKVKDSSGQEAQDSWPFRVDIAPLVVYAFASPQASASSPMDVDFLAAADGGYPPYTYDWDFGDTGTATGSSVSHTYVADGAYTAVCTVTDDAGSTADGSRQIWVNVGTSAVSGTVVSEGFILPSIFKTSLETAPGDKIDSNSRKWNDPFQAGEYDGSGTYCSLGTGAANSVSQYLKAKGLPQLNLTPGNITGIEVEVTRKASVASAVKDKIVRLIKPILQPDGSYAPEVVGDDLKDASWWSDSWETVTYGGPSETWGINLDTPSWMFTDQKFKKRKMFGVALRAENQSAAAVTAYVDYVRVKVYYGQTLPSAEPNVTVFMFTDVSGGTSGETYTPMTALDGTYSQSVPDDDYQLEPDKVNSLFKPTYRDATVSGSDVGDQDFEKMPTSMIFFRRQSPAKSVYMQWDTSGEEQWEFYFTTSRGARPFTVEVKDLSWTFTGWATPPSPPNVYAYLRKWAAPEPDDDGSIDLSGVTQFSSQGSPSSDRSATVTPPSGVTYWYVGIKVAALGWSGTKSVRLDFTINAKQP